MLQPCPACSRHLRAGSTACPFCDARFEPLAAPPAPHVPPALSRAALMALGALASVGCREANAQGHHAHDAGGLSTASDHGSPAAGYGGPPMSPGLVMPPSPASAATTTLGPVVSVHPNDTSLTATAARTTLQAAIPRVRLCYTRARDIHPTLAGTLGVRIAVNTSGAPTQAPEVSGIANASDLASCVAAQLNNVRFPAPHAASVVRASFTLAAH